MTYMSYADAVAKMNVLADANDDWQGDPEASHVEADNLLCEFLKASGFGLLVVQYDRIGKWYG